MFPLIFFKVDYKNYTIKIYKKKHYKSPYITIVPVIVPDRELHCKHNYKIHEPKEFPF